MDILDLLSTEKDVSGQMIADRLHISRAAVHKRVEKLREQGYKILGGNNLGYRLISRPHRLLAEEVKRQLSPASPALSIVIYPETVSTQTVAKTSAAGGAPEWTVVAAEKQTGAYGRMQRLWESPEGGLWFSLVLRPCLAPDSIPQITLIASIAVCRAIERSVQLSPAIKWPNDILVNDRKLAGILTEMSAEVGRINWLVIGIGINVNNTLPAHLRDASVALGAVTGAAVNQSKLLAAFIDEFALLYDGFRKEGFRRFAAEYNRRSFLAGKRISVDGGHGVHEGVVEKIDDDGYLWLRTADGLRKIVVGNVTVLKR